MTLSETALRAGRAAFRTAAALENSAKTRLWTAVQEIARVDGEVAYRVPSQSRPHLHHTVVKRRRAHAGEQVWQLYACSCEARRREACAHRAAVYQYLYGRRFGAVPVRARQQVAA